MWIKRFFLGLCAVLCAYLAVMVISTMVRRGQDPSMELTALEEQWADWEPPPARPLLCWMGYPIGHDYQCPEGASVLARAEVHPRLRSDYVRRNPQNPIYLKWPLVSLGRTSDFGWRIHPVIKARRFHTGIDEDCETGDEIFAAGEGQVVFAGWASRTPKTGYGWLVEISHGRDSRGQAHTSKYGHLSQVLVEAGDVVEPGDVIGKCGSTGMSTGSHLHFESWVNGRLVDPDSMLPR